MQDCKILTELFPDLTSKLVTTNAQTIGTDCCNQSFSFASCTLRVACDVEIKRISELNFDNCGLNEVPDLSTLPSLKALSFSSNLLSRVPIHLPNLPDLLSLNLSKNPIKGEIPDTPEWRLMVSRLQVLDLSETGLTGPFPSSTQPPAPLLKCRLPPSLCIGNNPSFGAVCSGSSLKCDATTQRATPNVTSPSGLVLLVLGLLISAILGLFFALYFVKRQKGDVLQKESKSEDGLSKGIYVSSERKEVDIDIEREKVKKMASVSSDMTK